MQNNEMLGSVLIASGIVQSMNDAKRLAEGGAISSLDTKEIVRDARAPAKKGTYKIGKRRFLKIT